MRSPVRLARDELVVDGERVQPEPEERIGVEHMWNEAVDLEVRVLGAATRLHPRLENGREEALPREDDRKEQRERRADRDQQGGGPEIMSIGNGQHERADTEAEEAAPRQGGGFDDEQEPDRHHQPFAHPMALLEPQIERGEDQQRHDQHDPQMIRVSGQGVRPVHVGAVDRAVDVDLACTAGDRREHRRVEVRSAPRVEELQYAIEGVDDDPAAEPRQRSPEIRPPAPREPEDGSGEEGEVDHPLRQALHPLAECVGVGQVEVPGEVDRQEEREETDQHRRRQRDARTLRRDEQRREKQDRQDVRDADVAGDVPVHLLERRDEERGEEQEARQPNHAIRSSNRASSSTRVRRDTRRRHSSDRGGASSSPRCQSRVQFAECGLDPLGVLRRHDDPGACLADQLRRRAVGWDEREDRPLGREVLEHLAAQNALAAPTGLGDQEQQRLRVALELERASPRGVGDELEPVTEPELLRPLAIRRAEVTKEARLDVEPALAQRSEERPRIALAEKRSGVRDAETIGGRVLEAGEVVEIRPVRDHHDLAAGTALSHLVRNRLGDTDDRVGRARDQLRNRMLALLLHAHQHSFGVAVRMSDDGIAQVGDPRNSGGATDGRADEVDRGGRRRGEDDVDALASCDPDRGRDRRQVPADVLVRDEQPPARELQLLRRALEPSRPVQLLRGLAPLRSQVAGAMHPGQRRHREPFVAVNPLRVVGREHVRLDPELRQVCGELQWTLYPAAPGRREVHRDQENLHCGRR